MRTLLVMLLGAAMLFGCATQEEKDSIDRSNEGYRLRKNRDYPGALNKFNDAVKASNKNHTAYYGRGLTYLDMKKYDDAAKDFEAAAKLRSKDAMYHLELGRARFLAAEADAVRRYVQTADDPEKAKDVDPSQVDMSGTNFEPAMAAFKTAAELNPDLFRAYYYIGKIHRYNGDTKAAADAFTKSIEANARYAPPYIALGEIYRLWGFTDQAIQVLGQGDQHILEPAERAELLFSLGMAYNDKKDWDNAANKFEYALVADKNHPKARFMLGLAYMKKKPPEYEKAREALELFQKNAKDPFMKGVAQKAILDIQMMKN